MYRGALQVSKCSPIQINTSAFPSTLHLHPYRCLHPNPTLPFRIVPPSRSTPVPYSYTPQTHSTP